MAAIYGTLQDFGLTSMVNSVADIVFVPSGPAVTSTNIFATRWQPIKPDADGGFQITLAPTDDKRPEMWYEPRIRWLDPGGNYTQIDFTGWRLYVPAEGGLIGDLLQAPWNPTLAWAGPDAPLGNAVANTLWLDTDDGALSIWSN